MDMRKGITPVISIVVLLLITVALAGAGWTYMSTYMSGLVGQSFEVRDSFILDDDTAVIMVANTGTNDIPVSEISIISTATGNEAPGFWTDAAGNPLPDNEIKVGETARWRSSFMCVYAEDCDFRIVGSGSRGQTARMPLPSGPSGAIVMMDIMIDNVNDLSGVQIDLSYNSTAVSYNNAFEGTFLSENGAVPTYFEAETNLTPGYIDDIIIVRLGSLPGVNGNGQLARIYFNEIDGGSPDVQLQQVLLSDSNATLITGATVTVVPV